MYKGDLITELSARTGLPRAKTRDFLDEFLDVVTEQLAAGDRVTITGFGSFERRERAAREGVNPQTGARMLFGPTITVGFSASKPLKQAVSG